MNATKCEQLLIISLNSFYSFEQNDSASIRSGAWRSIKKQFRRAYQYGTMPMCTELFGLLTKSLANWKFIGHCEISSWHEQNEQSLCCQRGNDNWFWRILRADIVLDHFAGGNQRKWLCITDKRHQFTTAANFPLKCTRLVALEKKNDFFSIFFVHP